MGDGYEQYCSIAGCDQVAHARGWCNAHYNRWFTTGDIKAEKPLHSMRTVATYDGQLCKVEGCRRTATAKAMCPAHYQRMRRDGEPGGVEVRYRRKKNG